MTERANEYNEFLLLPIPSFLSFLLVFFFAIDNKYCLLILSIKKREITNFNRQPEHSDS